METQEHRHGGPYDRGSADAYYWRPYNPHYYKGATYSTDRVDVVDMTPEQVSEYKRGFDSVHPLDRKVWEWD